MPENKYASAMQKMPDVFQPDPLFFHCIAPRSALYIQALSVSL